MVDAKQPDTAIARADALALGVGATFAWRLGDSGLIYARNDPFLDPVRSDQRFTHLLQGIGFD